MQSKTKYSSCLLGALIGATEIEYKLIPIMQIQSSGIECYGWQHSLGEIAPEREKSMKAAVLKRHLSLKRRRNLV